MFAKQIKKFLLVKITNTFLFFYLYFCKTNNVSFTLFIILILFICLNNIIKLICVCLQENINKNKFFILLP